MRIPPTQPFGWMEISFADLQYCVKLKNKLLANILRRIHFRNEK